MIGTVTSIPFKLYKTFVLEEKYGFNKTTLKTFVMDEIKAILITAVATVIIVPCLLWVVEFAGDQLVFSLSVLTISIVLLFNILVPILIIPCFYKYSELPDGDLKQAIFKEAEKTKVSVS